MRYPRLSSRRKAQSPSTTSPQALQEPGHPLLFLAGKGQSTAVLLTKHLRDFPSQGWHQSKDVLLTDQPDSSKGPA